VKRTQARIDDQREHQARAGMRHGPGHGNSARALLKRDGSLDRIMSRWSAAPVIVLTQRDVMPFGGLGAVLVIVALLLTIAPMGAAKPAVATRAWPAAPAATPNSIPIRCAGVGRTRVLRDGTERLDGTAMAPRIVHCTMNALDVNLQRGLEDLFSDLVRARLQPDLGRLALLCYCEVRPWARMAGEQRLAELSAAFFTQRVSPDRESFLTQIDELLSEVDHVRLRGTTPNPPGLARAA
jgi:hypothetical protein